jgi:urease accessory protein
MLVVQARIEGAARWDEELEMGFEQRSKTRLRTALRSGEEIGIFLPRGGVLRDGDFLRAADGRVVRVFAAREELMEARCDDALLLARAAYHLGNRHASVQVLANAVRFPSDTVLAQMLQGLGMRVEVVHETFDPEPGAYGGGGHQHSAEARHSGRIHDFAPRRETTP